MINSIQSTNQNNHNPSFRALTPGGKNVLRSAAYCNSDLEKKAEELIERAEKNNFVLLDILENDIMNKNHPSASILHNNQEVAYIVHSENDNRNIFAFAESAIKRAEEYVLKHFKES